MNGIFEKRTPFGLKGSRFTGFMGYPPMFHTHGELIYVTRGSIETTVDGKSHRLEAGELCILFPYLTHSYSAARDAEGILLLFDPNTTAFTNTLLNKKPVRHFTDGQALAPLLDRAVTMLKKGNTKTATGYLNAVIGELLEVLPLENSKDTSEDMAVKILDYCSAHYQENISVKSVSEALYISQSYVSKVFANALKYSFREYINQLRIQRAKELLQNSNMRIVDVMFACGFQNQSSFNRVFRSCCGVSPREYQNRLTY